MLERLLATIQASAGPIGFDDLSDRLSIERSALEPMLALLVRKGLLTEWSQAGTDVACGSVGCGASCAGVSGCPMGGMPRILEL